MADRATSPARGTVSERLLDVLGPWSQGPGPLFRKLARALAAAVERGALPDGARLPSERDLARTLAIGRGTAVAAYDVLVGEGLLERRRGSGSYVAMREQPLLPSGREGSELVHRLVAQDDAAAPDVVDLSISVLHEPRGMGAAPARLDELLAAVPPGTGYRPWGLPSLRRAVAEHLCDRGLPTDEHQVVITTGAQQAISAAAACWIQPGDAVVVDDPTYPGALAAFAQAGARVVPVPVDRHGVRVDALAEALRARPALVYVQSTLHSPTGAVLAAARRRTVADLVATSRTPLVEDLALAGLAWQEVPPPIASHIPEESVAVVGSLSKLFWGGLRVGFVRAPEPLALRFARIKATRDLGSSVVSQALAEQLLRAHRHADRPFRMAADLRARYEVLAAALGRELPDWTWSEPQGGLSVWVRLPGDASSTAFAQRALRAGVAVAAPGPLTTSGGHHDRLRLSFAPPPDRIEEGVRRLGLAWRAWAGAGG